MARETTGSLLYGLDESPMVELSDSRIWVHQALIAPLQKLRNTAAGLGFDVQVASGYRSFARQLHIWNAKARGERPVLDSFGAPLETDALSEREVVYAILRWSALPGASRHHWGSDIDVYDKTGLSEGYSLQLTVAETLDTGPFAPFHRWLDGYLTSSDNPGFFRPYAQDRGGIAPEPWHLSYAPIAQPLAEQLICADLHDLLAQTEMELKDVVLDNLDDIFARFIIGSIDIA